MDLVFERQAAEMPDLRHRVRQMRWFKASFRQHARLLGQRYGFVVDIDDSLLTEAFLNWGERFLANKTYARLDRRDFVTFAAGLLLRELLQLHPVTVREVSDDRAAPSIHGEDLANRPFVARRVDLHQLLRVHPGRGARTGRDEAHASHAGGRPADLVVLP